MTHPLPFRGLGLSSNLSVLDVPQPWALLQAEPGLFDVVEYSAPLELGQARREASLFPTLWEARERVPVLFHPVHLNLYGPELEAKEALANLDAHARAVGSAWVGNDVGWWHSGGEPLPGYLYLPPPLSPAGPRGRGRPRSARAGPPLGAPRPGKPRRRVAAGRASRPGLHGRAPPQDGVPASLGLGASLLGAAGLRASLWRVDWTAFLSTRWWKSTSPGAW